MLTDPDRPNMQRMIHASELATWPTVHLCILWWGSVLTRAFVCMAASHDRKPVPSGARDLSRSIVCEAANHVQLNQPRLAGA